MLKNMKAKALALLTALAMMLGLGAIAATPALAVTAGTGSLTVTGNDKFESVDAYQMFVVEGSQADSAKYTLKSAWNGFLHQHQPCRGSPKVLPQRSFLTRRSPTSMGSARTTRRRSTPSPRRPPRGR